jgi:hypothetical protein
MSTQYCIMIRETKNIKSNKNLETKFGERLDGLRR